MKRGLFALFLFGGCFSSLSFAAKMVHHKAKPHKTSQYVGVASWYGRQGKKMANGKPFDRRKFTCASRWLPLGSVARVTNLNSGLTTEVEVTDRGPHVKSRIVDLSEAAANKIGCVRTGLCKVVITKLPVFTEYDSSYTSGRIAPVSYRAHLSATHRFGPAA
jgi:rare lipoprotein A